MASNFDLTALAVKMIAPNNEILYDDTNGYPGVFVKIPKCTMADLIDGGSSDVHPAFIVNGKEIDAVYIGKYQSKHVNGIAYSLPGEDPSASANFDTFVARAAAAGEGFHEITAAEWGLIALWCKKNGTLPYGNNYYGRDSRESNYKAIPSMDRDSSNRIQRVATGTGPITWSHDRTPSGIWDLNGNVSEWVGGIRFVYGELQVLANNNAADSDNSQGASSSLWMAVDGTTGELITPDGSGTTTNSLKLDYLNNKWTWIAGSISSQSDSSRNCAFVNVAIASSVTSSVAKELLYALALAPDDTSFDYEGDYFYFNNGAAERCVIRGGNWGDGANGGVFCFNGYDARSAAGTNIGGRSAYVEI